MRDVKSTMDYCYESTAPSIVMEVDAYKNGYVDVRRRGGRIRVITEITKHNLEYCRKLMRIVDELRHLDHIQGGLAVSDSAYMTSTTLQAGKPLTQVTYSNVQEAVKQQQNFFNSLWERAIPASQKIRDVSNQLENNKNYIFSALDNQIRRSTIFYLKERNMRTSHLARKLEISLQAFQKHLSKLIESGLVIKNNEGILSLSQIGLVILEQIPLFQFLFDYREFFKTHSLSFIPDKFLQRLGDLQETELVTGVTRNIKKCQEILDEKTVNVQFIDMPIYLETHKEDFSKLIKKTMNVRYILGENSLIPGGWRGISQKLDYKKSGNTGMIERRMIKDIHIILYVSDKSAIIVFPDLEGNPDVNAAFFSKDDRFLNWCSELFEELWKNSRTFIEERIKQT